jgi:hypothetical protein
MPGHKHGSSIKHAKQYEALRRQGMSKSSAAAISNASGKGGKKKRSKRKG